MAVAYRWTLGLARVLERTTRWILANTGPEDQTSDLIALSGEGLEALRGKFPEIVSGEDRDVFLSRVSEVKNQGVDESFANDLITLRFLDQLLEILRLARRTEADPVDAARYYYQVTEEIRIPWLTRCIERAGGAGGWGSHVAVLANKSGAMRVPSPAA